MPASLRRILALLAALSVVTATTLSAAPACADDAPTHALQAVAEDCSHQTPAPPSQPHQECEMFASCAAVAVLTPAVDTKAVSAPEVPPAEHPVARPALVDRSPEAPPPKV